MRIGVDVDDTITNSWECLMPYFSSYFNIPISKLRTSKPYYESVKDKVSLDEYFEIVTNMYDKAIINSKLKDNVKETIDKLYELGHTVYFISARGKGHHHPYEDTKKYLDYHKIKYEKIITNVARKDLVCLEEKIDLFIDDSYKHCLAAKKQGINVLMMNTEYNKNDIMFPHVNNWQEVYDYIVKEGDNIAKSHIDK